jgi:hypothetical protein
METNIITYPDCHFPFPFSYRSLYFGALKMGAKILVMVTYYMALDFELGDTFSGPKLDKYRLQEIATVKKQLHPWLS